MKGEGGRMKGDTRSHAPRPSNEATQSVEPCVPTRSVGTRDKVTQRVGQCVPTQSVGPSDSGSTFPLPPSPFILLLDPPASGAWNMAVDEALLEAAAAEGQSTLRFYRWAEPTLSLGYFQTYGDHFQHEASRGCAVVRRPSGGGAILHDRELTYSLAVPERHPLAATRLRTYRAVHQALIAALGRWGIEAGMLTCSEASPARTATSSPRSGRACPPLTMAEATAGKPARFTAEIAEAGRDFAREPFLCFQRRSPGDVLVGGVKVAGSAQRRCRGAVLQHGSLLLARSPAAP